MSTPTARMLKNSSDCYLLYSLMLNVFFVVGFGKLQFPLNKIRLEENNSFLDWTSDQNFFFLLNKFFDQMHSIN